MGKMNLFSVDCWSSIALHPKVNIYMTSACHWPHLAYVNDTLPIANLPAANISYCVLQDGWHKPHFYGLIVRSNCIINLLCSFLWILLTLYKERFDTRSNISPLYLKMTGDSHHTSCIFWTFCTKYWATMAHDYSVLKRVLKNQYIDLNFPCLMNTL